MPESYLEEAVTALMDTVRPMAKWQEDAFRPAAEKYLKAAEPAIRKDEREKLEAQVMAAVDGVYRCLSPSIPSSSAVVKGAIRAALRAPAKAALAAALKATKEAPDAEH